MELLIITSLFSILSAFVPFIVKIAINWLYRISEEEILLLLESTNLKEQMNAISMVDEFAKHAKLQRKLIKINDELKRRAASRFTASMRNKLIYTYSLHAVMGLTLLCIVWLNRSVPVIVFPEARLWPITTILSWPTGVPGGISVAVWIFFMNRVARGVAAYLTHRLFLEKQSSRKKMKENADMVNFSFSWTQEADQLH